MVQDTIRLSIPITLLADVLAGLTLREKYQLLEILETQIAEAEEEAWEKDPTTRNAIHEARIAYQTGQYITIDEYGKNQS
jgi:hypothetical protein